jgi:serpin B
MAHVLDVGSLTLQALNDDNAALEAALIDPDPDVTLTVANSLWIDESAHPVKPSFTQADETYYGATVGDLAGAPANVNAWVDAATHGLIPQILPPDLPPSTFKVAIIANTLYFKGKWTTAFDPSQTDTGAFTLGDGSEVTADLMHQAGTLPYLESTFKGSRFQAIRLPYGEGRLSMLIVLPQTGTPIGPFVAGVTLEDLTHWIAGLQPTAVSIALPRFRAQYSQNLVTALSSLGMRVAFAPQEADFAALAPGAYVSSVVHSTVVEVGESGTTAAAGTVVTITTTIVGVEPTMAVDHPFFYAIEDEATGELLFIGILMNPTTSAAG